MGAKILLTGATGYLGRYLVAVLSELGATVVTAGRSGCDLELDLLRPEGFAAALGTGSFDLVINSGAMSSMAACQREPTVALQVNGRSPARLAAAAGCRFVQVSTDLVFDGDGAPYEAGRSPRPLSVYGMSKAAAETSGGEDWLVVRLPLLFGRSHDGRRGATDMLRSAVGAKERLVLFADEFRTPIHAADAARGLAELGLDPRVRGIRHVAGAERVSRWELAERFCAATGVALDSFRPGLSQDPRRPRDVALVADWQPGRDLDQALAEC